MNDIGLHFLVGIASTKLSNEERELLKQLSPAGIILFRKNISPEADWFDQLAALLTDIKTAIGRKQLLLGVDHEGGKVHRFYQSVTQFPAAITWQDSVEEVARAMSCELQALGFNTGFSPVLDIHSRPENPVIGQRALATTPQEVAQYAQRFIKALTASGLVACGKHFPGHGDTTTDSHFELPVVAASEQELRNRELLPFQAAIAAGVPMLMTAHVHYPALDADNPATLSPKILKGLLRDELGFAGVVVSDDLQMKALAHLTPQEIGLQALGAGVDMLLVGNVNEETPLARAQRMAVAIAAGLKRGELDVVQLQQSQKRVSMLLENILKNGSLADLSKLGCVEHQQLALRLAGK